MGVTGPFVFLHFLKSAKYLKETSFCNFAFRIINLKKKKNSTLTVQYGVTRPEYTCGVQYELVIRIR